MPAQLGVVHDEAAFKSAAVQALRGEGYSVASFPDAFAATAALAMASRIELLITRLQFAEGRTNGVALALMTRTRTPGVKLIFTGRPEMREYTASSLRCPSRLTIWPTPFGRNFPGASPRGLSCYKMAPSERENRRGRWSIIPARACLSI